MQHLETTHFNAQLTNLSFQDYEVSADFDAFPETVAYEEREPAPELPVCVIPSTCLSLQPPRGRLRNWRLASVRADVEQFTPNHIIGAVVQVDKGRTSPIESIDPATRRIRTSTGSIYELLDPQEVFAQASPEVLRSLGF